MGDIGHVVAVEADRGDVALVDVDEVLVDPAVGLRPVVVEGLLVGAAADVAHRADAAPLDLRAAVLVLRRQPGLPHVGRLDDVVVDADDLRELRHGQVLRTDVAPPEHSLTTRQKLRSAPLTRRARSTSRTPWLAAAGHDERASTGGARPRRPPAGRRPRRRGGRAGPAGCRARPRPRLPSPGRASRRRPPPGQSSTTSWPSPLDRRPPSRPSNRSVPGREVGHEQHHLDERGGPFDPRPRPAAPAPRRHLAGAPARPARRSRTPASGGGTTPSSPSYGEVDADGLVALAAHRRRAPPRGRAP